MFFRQRNKPEKRADSGHQQSHWWVRGASELSEGNAGGTREREQDAGAFLAATALLDGINHNVIH